jgi:hypothetical protein
LAQGFDREWNVLQGVVDDGNIRHGIGYLC